MSGLVARLQTLDPVLVVLEATVGHELAVVAALAGAGLPVVVVNPRQVRDFARATGNLAKTDRLDAQALALFAQRVRPAPHPCRVPRPRSWVPSWPVGDRSWGWWERRRTG